MTLSGVQEQSQTGLKMSEYDLTCVSDGKDTTTNGSALIACYLTEAEPARAARAVLGRYQILH